MSINMASEDRKDKPSKDEKTNSVSKKNLTILTRVQRLSYSVGHVQNDLTASMWFSYLLIFLHNVNKFNNLLSGNLMLIGQVADALSTLFIGFESDRTRSGCFNLGKRKTWHATGTICVMASFTFLFMKCIGCENTADIYQFFYYAPIVVIFQFGWASVQISHLSFASDFTPYPEERVTLNSLRNMFTVFANISLFGIFAMLFYLGGSGHIGNTDVLGPADAPKFRNLAMICIGIGFLFNIIFYLGTRERRNKKDAEKGSVSNYGTLKVPMITNKNIKAVIKLTWKDWLKQREFYQIAVLYMGTRLYINVSQVYLAMYLTETISLSKIYIALLPLFVYIANFVTSSICPLMNKHLGRKLTYFIGILFAAASSVWLYFVPKGSHQVYGSSILMGVAGAILLITALSMTSDLIGENTCSGAFVFGAMSFTDKLSNGIAILIIQKYHPCGTEVCCSACDPYYRFVISVIPAAAIGLSLLAFLSLLPVKFKAKPPCEDPLVECKCGGTCDMCGQNAVSKQIAITKCANDKIAAEAAAESSPLLINGYVNQKLADVMDLPNGHVTP